MATLQLQFLEDQPNKHHILSALEQLPRGLDQTYGAAIFRIKSQPNPERIELALKALKWLTFAKEHLQATALRHALAIKEETTDIEEGSLPNLQMIVAGCMGLVVLDQESGNIHLVHETTQQYLQEYFQDQRENGDEEIARVCLYYFSFPQFSRRFEGFLSLDEHLARYPLSSYASRYWFVHIREGNVEGRFVPAILKIFECQGVRDAVFRIAEAAGAGDSRLYFSKSTMLTLLHLASMHGLPILCGEILGQISGMQRLYFYPLQILIPAKY